MAKSTKASPVATHLRQVVESDLPIFFEHQCDPEAIRMVAFPARSRDVFMTHWAKILADNGVLVSTIVVDGQVAGYVLSWLPEDKRLIGYWLGREYWGKGIATRSLRAYLKLVADRPLYAYVAKHNVGSIRVLEKCGFTLCTSEPDFKCGADDVVEEFLFKLD